MITKDLIFMGQPGVGKGTVASLLASKTDLVHISTGNIFREEIANKSALGLEVEKIVTTGGYVPDEITNAIVTNALEKLQKQNKHFILDGYPRTLAQAQFLNSLPGFNFKVIELVAPEELIYERLSGRRSCPVCKTGYHVKFIPPKKPEICDNDNSPLQIRKDDTINAIKHRLDIYQEQTKPLIEYYKQIGNLEQIQATSTPEEIATKVLEKLS